MIMLTGLLALVLVFLLAAWLPPAVDWHLYFRPAAQELLHGRSPYTVEGFPSPPWALLPMLPLALLPEHVGRALFFVLSLGAFVYAAYRLGASATTMLFFLLSPPVLHSLLNGNEDSLVLLGFVLPPPVGLLFLSIKPQMGAGVALFWLVEAWREGKLLAVAKTFTPVAMAWLASFLLFGLWPLRWQQEIDQWWNASAWPLSIPVGLALLVAAMRLRRKEFAMAAAPCLSPYVLLHAWAGALAALMTLPAEMIAAVLGLWIIVLSLLLGF
ncbi:MAG: hypothetical protein IPM39_17735 [Chloroflexi bacterium]|nr:hypothetical protein [Chloroflexota bacterium]